MENKDEVKETKMSKYYLVNMLKYWLRTMKLMYRYWRGSEFSEITVDELHDRINSNQPPFVIDIRSTQEFNGADGHISNARSIPIRKLSGSLEDLPKEKEIIAYCPGGGMSLIAVDILAEAGFQAFSLHGGLDLWIENGYPTTTS